MPTCSSRHTLLISQGLVGGWGGGLQEEMGIVNMCLAIWKAELLGKHREHTGWRREGWPEGLVQAGLALEDVDGAIERGQY